MNYSEFENPSGLPIMNKSGVYAIYLFDYFKRHMKIVYIGSSKKLRKRVYNVNHVYYKLCQRSNYLVGVLDYYCDNYIEEEKRLIKKYKPILNRVQYVS